MKKLTKCTSCGGRNLVSRRITRSFGTRMEDIVVVQDVPVIVCRDCGERYIPGPILKRIQGLLQNRAKLRKAKVPVAHV